jgi:hypothetical protein
LKSRKLIAVEARDRGDVEKLTLEPVTAVFNKPISVEADNNNRGV